jgi:hypothetical protein
MAVLCLFYTLKIRRTKALIEVRAYRQALATRFEDSTGTDGAALSEKFPVPPGKFPDMAFKIP